MSQLGRNDPCSCGSGKKYKKCCLANDEKSHSEQAYLNSIKKMLSGVRPNRKQAVSNSFIDYISTHDTADAFNCLVGIQLIAENHGKNVRIEEMALEMFRGINNNAPVELSRLKREIKSNYPYSMMEDMPGNFFTETALFHGGNFTVMPGIATRSGDVFKAISESVFLLTSKISEVCKDEIYQGAMLLLELGKHIFDKAGISGNLFTEAKNRKIIVPNEIVDYSIPLSEVQYICRINNISDETLASLILNHSDKRIDFSDPNLNPLLYTPLVLVGNSLHFPLITAQLLAINEYVVNTVIKHSCTNEFIKSYNDLLWNNCMLGCLGMRWEIFDFPIPENRNKIPMRENVFQFDTNGFCYFVYPELVNIKSKYDEYELEDFEGANNEGISNRVDEVLSFMRSQSKYADSNILVLYVLPEIGDGAAFYYNKEKYNEEICLFKAFEFINLAASREWGPLSLYKFAFVYREFTKKSEINSFDTLDTYSVYKDRDESFYASDKPVGHTLAIVPGSGADIYREAKRTRDFKGVISLNNSILGYNLVERFDGYDSIYKLADSDSSELVITSYRIPIWIKGKFVTNISIGVYQTTIASVAFWLNRLSTISEIFFVKYSNKVLVIELQLDDCFFKSDLENIEGMAQGDMDFKFKYNEDGVLLVRIPGGVFTLLKSSNNEGERKIVFALIQAFNDFLLLKIDFTVFQEHFDRIMPLGSAKMILVLNSNNDLRLDNRWLEPVQNITPAEVNLLLDNFLDIIDYPKKLKVFNNGNDKAEFCNYAVKKLFEHLQILLDVYKNVELLDFLMRLNEAITFERSYKRIIIPAKILCFGNKDKIVQGLLSTERDSVKTSLCVRCLIEYIAAKPAKGNKIPGYNDVDKLLAVFSEALNFGMVSDSIRFGLDEPTIEVLPSGRLAVESPFQSDMIIPFSNANTYAEIEGYVDIFDSFFESEIAPVHPEDNNIYRDRVNNAFMLDWGVSLSLIFEVLTKIANYGINFESSVVIISKELFLENFSTDLFESIDKLKVCLDLLSLQERGEYFTAPEGYKNEDVFPWKYNREFSLLRRPIVEFKDDSGLPCLMWGIRSAVTAAKQIEQLFRNGRLKYGKENINLLLGENNEELGKSFRKRVLKWFKSFPDLFVSDFEVTITTNGHLRADKNYGDIDILVFDSNTSIAYNIECKRTHQAKNIHEMKTEQDSYVGRPGQKKKIQRHVDRHEWLLKNKSKLGAFLNAKSEIIIKSFLLTAEVASVKYIMGDSSPLPLISFPELKEKGLKLLADL
ncbi:MAG: SEC-C metal-binding domain-containing protein [Bacteroidota bacterium]